MEIQQLIDLFGALFYVSLAVAIIGLGLALFFFFFFDIPTIFAWKFGKLKRQTVTRMENQNAKTGRLIHNPQSGNIKRSGPVVIQPPAPPVVNAETTQLDGSNETSVLSEQVGETSVLGGKEAETSVLNPRGAGVLAKMEEQIRSYVPPIRFEVTESTLVIHTEEII